MTIGWQCLCDAAGPCATLKRTVTERQRQICRHEILTPEKCSAYVGLWLAAAKLADDPTAAGNRVASLAKRLGLPHCGGCEDRRVLLNRLHGWVRGDKPPADKLRFVTTQQLAVDVLTLASQVPPKLAGVVGVARSGLLPASLLAMHLHLPLGILREDAKDAIAAGHGWRLGKQQRPNGPLLVVDDTVMSGTSLRKSKAIAAKALAGRELLWAAIYVAPSAKTKPDIWVHDLEAPHFLEWNLFNSVHLPRMAFDYDGILTIDGTTRPQYLPRRGEIPLIITGRGEQDRVPSLAWLAQHGVRVRKLIMFPGQTPSDPLPIARYKAEHFAASGLSYFVESDPVQAAEMARLAKRPVICPAAGEVFP
jgi:orotate phosphoribosyltransferase